MGAILADYKLKNTKTQKQYNRLTDGTVRWYYEHENQRVSK
jgi:hypothetical protein